MHTMQIRPPQTPADNLSLPEDSHARSVITATLLDFGAGGCIRVLLPGEQVGVPALSAIGLTESDVGRTVLLAFGLRAGDLPVITGRPGTGPAGSAPRAKIDGDRVVIQASRELELRCGDASIVLTHAGKVLIRGTFVLSHSRGMNRIRGAAVHLN